MTNERRSENRTPLAQPPRREIRLQFGGRTIPIENVIDVSTTGVGVLISEFVSSGTPVEVLYRNGDVDIALSGITVWDKANQPDGTGGLKFAVGISLMSPTLLHTFL